MGLLSFQDILNLISGKPGIDDSSTTSLTNTWSAKKTVDYIASSNLSAVELVIPAGTAIGTIIGQNANYIKTTNTTGTGETLSLTGLSNVAIRGQIRLKIDSKNAGDTLTGFLSGNGLGLQNTSLLIGVGNAAPVSTNVSFTHSGGVFYPNNVNIIYIECVKTVGGFEFSVLIDSGI